MKRFYGVSKHLLLVGTLIGLPMAQAAAQQQEAAAPPPGEALPPPADTPAVAPAPASQATETTGPVAPAKRTRSKANEQTEEIVVTGSRIRSSPTDAPAVPAARRGAAAPSPTTQI
jgi:hypothetical protein